jgi:hypothetical protein
MPPLTLHCGATSALVTCFGQILDGCVSQMGEAEHWIVMEFAILD